MIKKQKFHISDDGIVRKCTADLVGCRFTEHYESIKEAYNSIEEQYSDDEFQTIVKQSQKSKTAVPLGYTYTDENNQTYKNLSAIPLEKIKTNWPHGKTKSLELSEVKEICYKLDVGEPVAFIQKGSFLFNLDTPESDRDLMIVVDKDLRKPKWYVVNEDDDVNVMSWKQYVSNIKGSSEIYTSSEFGFNEDSPYVSYLKNVRPNYYESADSFGSSAISNMRVVLKEKIPERQVKFAKRALKDNYAYRKMCSIIKGESDVMRYTENERNLFYTEFDNFKKFHEESPEEAMKTLQQKINIQETETLWIHPPTDQK